jgi:hypothetical protein
VVVPAGVPDRVRGANNIVIDAIRRRCGCTSRPYYIRDVAQADGGCRFDVRAPSYELATTATSYIKSIENGLVGSVAVESSMLAGSCLSSAEIARIETSTNTLIVLYKPAPERTLLLFAGHTLVSVNQAKEAIEKAVGMYARE